MKKHEDTIREVHRRINEYEAEKKLRRTRNFKIAAAVTPVCAAAVVGVGLWKGGALSSDNAKMSSSKPDIITSEQNTTVMNTTPEVIVTESFVKQTEPVTKETKVTETVPTENEEPATKETPTEAKVTQNTVTAQNDVPTTIEATTKVKETQNIVTTQHEEIITQEQPTKTTETPVIPGGMTELDMGAVKCINNIVYMQILSADQNYTCGEYIGDSSEFIGFPENGSIYYSNESPDVIIIRYTEYSHVALKKTDISAEQYKIEYERIKEMIDSKRAAF